MKFTVEILDRPWVFGKSKRKWVALLKQYGTGETLGGVYIDKNRDYVSKLRFEGRCPYLSGWSYKSFSSALRNLVSRYIKSPEHFDEFP